MFYSNVIVHQNLNKFLMDFDHTSTGNAKIKLLDN